MPGSLASLPATLIELLIRRMELGSDSDGYTFLADGESAEEWLSYAEMCRRAFTVATLLQQAGARGEPVLLLFPPGLEYVAGVFGCVCAGAIAVPAYPPDPTRIARTLPRLASLVADARARVALTTRPIRALIEAMGAQAGALGSLRWLAIEDAEAMDGDGWRPPDVAPHDVAILQYTSGSTGTPRGVMLTHANLLHNSAAIHRLFEHGPGSRGVIWLPPYHDMGLIGGVLQPLYGGFPVVLMSPLAFLARPLRWLNAVSRYHATTSGGPNFAYDLCVRKTTPADRAMLDLSSWTLAFNGAEPIQPETLDRFCEAFAPSGFRREAFFPCYGLAEGTLIAAGGMKANPPVIRRFDKAALDRGIPRPPIEGGSGRASSRALVGCGTGLADQELRIADPERLALLEDGHVGEIWLRGPSVARGYWGREEDTIALFGARPAPADDSTGWLRTGDLGFLSGGELFVTGRIKDLVIVRGRNHYPQDIERTALGCHNALRPGCAAAFAIEADGEERLAIVLEADPSRLSDPGAVVDAIRRSVAAEHELQAYAVMLLPPGSVPKTSSGKVQRRAAREQYRAGEFAPLAASVLAAVEEPPDAGAADAPEPGALRGLDEPSRGAALVRSLRRWAASILGMPADYLATERPLTAFGMDSIRAMELAGRIADAFGVELPISALLDGMSIDGLAAHVGKALAAAPGPGGTASRSEDPAGEAPLSPEQERLLFLHELAPGSAAYHIAVAVRIEGSVDRDALARSLAAIVARHAILRARYVRRGGRWVQHIATPDDRDATIDFGEEDVAARPLSEEAALALALADARRPFDLERGPILRARLVRVTADRHLFVLVVHHIAADGWSMGLLVHEFSALYGAFAAGRPDPLPPLSLQYADLAAQTRRWIETDGMASDLAWWREQLRGAPPACAPPTDRPRPATQSFAGARVPIALDAALSEAVRRLAASQGATPFMVLLAGFFALLAERTGSDDLVVGTDFAGRDSPHARALLGLFVNQLVVRIDAGGAPSFGALLDRVRRATLGAYARSRVPFDRLVEALRPPRDPGRNPVFQTMFVLESAPLPALTLPGLRLETIELDDGGSPFDLSVLLAERDGRFAGVFRYATALYEAATIAALADDYVAFLASITANPSISTAELASLARDRARLRAGAAAEALRADRLERFRMLPRR